MDKKERVKTEPLNSRSQCILKAQQAKVKYPEEMMLKAESIGLTRALVRNRVRKGWTFEAACTTPKVSLEESLRRARANSPLREQVNGEYRMDCKRSLWIGGGR
ncbi:MAG: hypothetical protein FWF59_01405 [Turicibacter sp.]|nr:hypothetical protein [Turicibacter sp.]